MPSYTPSRVPVIAAVVGLALAVIGASLTWVDYRSPENGFERGWMTAHARYVLTGGDWNGGGDGITVIVISASAVAMALVNRRVRDQRVDRTQFALGAIVVGIALSNGFFNQLNHTVYDLSDPPGADDVLFGPGLVLTLLSGIATAFGALLGNTPEFIFDDTRPSPGFRE